MSRDEFHELFVQILQERNFDHDTVARVCKVSRGTVDRYLAGQSAPHPVGRESVINALRNT